MITEMYIEGQPCDVSENLSTLITYALDDIKDFSSRNTSFSKTIVLPGTANNNKIFGHVFEMQGSRPYDAALPNVLTNFNAAKSAQCYLFQDNIQVFKGVVRLMEIIIDKGRKEYEVAVFGELGGLISALGNKRLEELDFSAYNRSFSVANIVGSWDNTPGSGVYFPLIDYGNASTAKHNWDYHTFRPAFYAKEYIDKIFAATPYKYSCALFNTARFKSQIIPHNTKILTKISNIGLDVAKGDTTYTEVGSYSEYMALPTHTTLGNFITSDSVTYTYNTAQPLTGLLRLIFSFHLTGSSPTNSFRLIVYKNGTTELGRKEYSTTFTSLTDSFELDIRSIYFGNTDNLKVQLQIDQAGTLEFFGVELQIVSDAATTVPININESIDMNSTLPKNILQKDFFSSILKLYNLYVYEDRDTPYLLNITPYKDFYNIDPSTAVDWTYKLNRDKAIHVKPLSEINSRYYQFSYKSDSDYWNELYTKRYNQNYGDYIYDSQFEFAQEVNKAEIIFSGTPLVGYQSEDKIYSTILKQTGTTSIVEENVDSNIRILQTKKILSVSSWDIKDGSTVLGSYTVYGYAGHLDDPNASANDLNFGAPKELFFVLAAGALNVNQFNVYWSAYMAEITDKDSRLLTASFRLNARDIYNLDFSKFIHIDGNLFRLNKIEDYNASNEDECTVTLLKVIELVY
jgi:hypothetical protein